MGNLKFFTRVELGILILIVLGGIGVRFAHIREQLLFQGDQGRDAIIAKHILKDGDVALVGPVTSVGNMYLGPFYYYFMVPWLALTYPDPVGPAYGVAIFSIIGIGVFIYLCRLFLSAKATLVAVALYTLLDVSVTYSRFSWNPNLAPVISTLMLLCLYKAVMEKKPHFWIGIGATVAILLQLHYVSLIVVPVIAMFYIWQYLSFKGSRQKLFIAGGLATLIILISFIPLVIFDFRHDHLITRSFMAFFTSSEEHIKPLNKLWMVIAQLKDRSILLLSRFMGWPANYWLDRLVLGLFVGTIAYNGWRWRSFSQKKRWIFFGLLIFIVATIGATAFYSSPIYDHYLLFMLPVLCLFVGFLADQGLGRSIYLLYPVLLLVVVLIGFNIKNYPSLGSAPAAIDNYKQVADDTLIHLPDGDYNLALLSSDRDYKGMNYRYFFEIKRPPLSTDEYTKLTTLVIIDELGVENQAAAPIFEVQASGSKKLTYQFTSRYGVIVSLYTTETNNETPLQ